MEDKIRKIMDESTDYQTGEVDAEIAISKLLDLFSAIDSFDIDCSELNKEDQFHLQRLFWDGKVKIKISL